MCYPWKQWWAKFDLAAQKVGSSQQNKGTNTTTPKYGKVPQHTHPSDIQPLILEMTTPKYGKVPQHTYPSDIQPLILEMTTPKYGKVPQHIYPSDIQPLILNLA